MPIELVDLDTHQIYGPFATPAEAKTRAVNSGFTSFEIWDEEYLVERVTPVNPNQMGIGL